MSDLVPANEPTAAELALLAELGQVGLEDIDATDIRMPWMKIDHPLQRFIDPFEDDKTYEELEVVLLGLIKQRTLFPAEMEGDGGAPLCKSFDHDWGFPDVERFPWAESGFEQPADLNSDDRVELPCEDCRLKEFGTNPKNPKAPWCSERHVYPMLVFGDGGSQQAVLIAAQKTSIKPSRSYLNWFVQNKRPPFTVKTRLSLEAERRGTTGPIYSVMRFERLGNSDSKQWTYWADQYTKIKEMLTTPFFRDSNNEQPVAAPQRAPRQATKAPTENIWSEGDDE